MLNILALATLAFSPIVTFTSDSVYTKDNILEVEINEHYVDDVLVQDIYFQEKSTLGYTIYDNPETSYIDGLQFDNTYVYDWVVKDINTDMEHYVTVKTVYTDDVAGMLIAAKNGDFSLAFKNPLIMFQLVYNIITFGSTVGCTVMLTMNRRRKIKDLNDISNMVDRKTSDSTKALQKEAVELVNNVVTPVLNKVKEQNQAMLEALMLSQSGGKDAKLAIIDLVKKASTENMDEVSNIVSKSIAEADALKAKAIEEADKTVKEIAQGNFEENNDVGGISI